jgi:hypothetical protein
LPVKRVLCLVSLAVAILATSACGGGGSKSNAPAMHPIKTPQDVAFVYPDKAIRFMSDGTTIEIYTDWYYKGQTKTMAQNLCVVAQGDFGHRLPVLVYDGTHEQLLAHTDSGDYCQAG